MFLFYITNNYEWSFKLDSEYPFFNDGLSRFKARIDEAEECIDGLNSKTATTEKLRNRYQVELEDLQVLKKLFSYITISTIKYCKTSQSQFLSYLIFL